MGDHSVKIKNSFARYSRSAKLGILFVAFCFSQVRNISAGSFYQRGLPDTRISNADFSFSPIQPLPVRELLSNHRISSLRNGNKLIPASKLDVLFVDLNDIDKSETRRPIVSSRQRGRSTNYPSRFNSVQYNRPRQQYRQQSYARNKQSVQNEHILQIERVPVSEIQDILNLLPNIETQIEKLNRQERTRVSSYNTSNNRKNNNINYGGYSGNRKSTSRQPFTNRMLTKRTNSSLMRNNNSVRNTVRTREETVVYN